MSPIFCKSKIPFEAIGSHMQDYVRIMGIGEKPYVLLVEGMRASETLIATALLCWYLQHGMQVTKIHQVVEYQKKRCFEVFADKISDALRDRDLDPDLKIVAEMSKTKGNPSFGSQRKDKTRHTHISYYKGLENVARAVNEPTFQTFTCLNDQEQFYEVQSAKARIKLDVPIQIALLVLLYGPQRMLEWHLDF